MHVALRTVSSSPASEGNVTFSTAQEIPIGDLLEEAFVEFRSVQRFLPRLMEFEEVAELVLLIERIERQLRQDVKMRAVRIDNINIFDERHLLEHILSTPITLTGAAVDDGEG